MQTLAPFIVSLFGGIIGGIIAGILFRKWTIGVMGNALAGLFGGGLAAKYLGTFGLGSVSILGGYLVSGLVGGAAIMMITGLIREARKKGP
ncbi:MAG: hypothetical protein GKR95_17730 [Gammaproteobacteria bacterium]|nr:hypothetical protein [Gammaproteobacteria bacterium]